MYAALRKVGDVPRDELDEQVKIWADDVRDLSYRMEDIVDKFLVRVEGAEPAIKPRKLKRLIKKMGNLFTKGKTRHEIADEIKGIKARVQEAADRRDRYRVDDVVANPASAATVDPRLLALYKDPKELVGVDDQLIKLTEMLTDGDTDVSKQLKIVSIVGFGGIGKTSLAKAVYDELRAQFDCSAFVPVGRNPSVKKLLNDILFEVDKQKLQDYNLSMLDERQLIYKLQESLENKRYFIVIDDMWDLQTWDFVRCALVRNNCASRIIITTRLHDAATVAGEVYRLQPLSHDLSKQLFLKRLSGGKHKCPDDLPVNTYNKFLHKCGGVPLAIITIASLLVSKPVELWSRVYNSIGLGLEDNMEFENMRKILLFSYYDLPCHLKNCLLYLSVYPEDHFIAKDNLIWKWVAEGFIHEEPRVGLSEIAERCFIELVNKSMILPVESPNAGIIVGCYVHDMLLDIICMLSEEQNFVTALGSQEQYRSSHNNARRLAIGLRSLPLEGKCMHQIRSFNAMCGIDKLPSLSCFQALRVLAIEGEGGYYTDHLKHLGMLVHLRYLGLRDSHIRELPEEIGNLKFLQTLHLCCDVLEVLPQSVSQLSQLKCMRINGLETRVPDWIGKLTSLEELWICKVHKSSNFVDELGKLTELRILRIARGLCLLSVSSSEAWVRSLVKLQKIQLIDIGEGSSYAWWYMD